jgi:L-serine dehydratase
VNRRNFCKIAVLSSAGVGSMHVKCELDPGQGNPVRRIESVTPRPLKSGFTAPTLGSAGTMPAIVTAMKQMKLSQDTMRKGLMAAGLVGFFCKNNASVAGAEVGCRAEIGVASAMAAAMITYATGASLEATEVAATIALEHYRGMSCDPVGGFVLIPASRGMPLALSRPIMPISWPPTRSRPNTGKIWIGSIMAMLETGKALPTPFKEMGTGGLGITMVDC